MNNEKNITRRYFDGVHLSDTEFSSGKQHVQLFMKTHPVMAPSRTPLHALRPLWIKVRTFAKKMRFPLFRKPASTF